jgi:hypothetical protein
MKQILFIISFIVFSSFCYGQNWNCFVPGAKQYFTNSYGYLRGMRIDSVKTVGSTMVYYPFHTPRGRNDMDAPPFDTTGSSWLGKDVTRLSDGTFLFNNLFDTVIIKTEAGIGESWILYNDTSHNYYKAQVVSIDTMSFATVSDSVKRIILTAYHDTSIVSTDSLNGFEIILSKAHGFVRIFDVYTFPYHQPDSASYYGSVNIDYYLANSMQAVPYGDGFAGKINSQYDQIHFINLSYQQLYDWNIGDVLEYSFCADVTGCISAYGPTEYRLDTVVNIIGTGTKIMYACKGWVSRFTVDSTGMHTFYKTTYKNDTLIYDNSVVFDTSLMPEEYKQPYIYYYCQGDSAFCSLGTLYKKYHNLIVGAGPPMCFEPITTSDIYKGGWGLLDHEFNDVVAGPGHYTLIYADRNDTICGSYTALNVHNINEIKKLDIYPNPANDEVIIKAEGNTSELQIDVINIFGQIVLSTSTKTTVYSFNVKNFPSGVYNVRVGDEGKYFNQKLVVGH